MTKVEVQRPAISVAIEFDYRDLAKSLRLRILVGGQCLIVEGPEASALLDALKEMQERGWRYR